MVNEHASKALGDKDASGEWKTDAEVGLWGCVVCDEAIDKIGRAEHREEDAHGDNELGPYDLIPVAPQEGPQYARVLASFSHFHIPKHLEALHGYISRHV